MKAKNETQNCGCSFKPTVGNNEYPGPFATCNGAMIDSRKLPRTADGCYYCSGECNS